MSGEAGMRTEVPYKELDYFEETPSDQLGFAGREAEIREVVARIAVNRALVLYGRSGLGKTSLLRAGVFPELRKLAFLPIYIRTLDAPLADLAAVLRDPARCPMEPPAEPDEGLQSLLRRLGGTTHVPVLVFDQFEEFFTRFALRMGGYVAKRRERALFVNRISALASDPDRDVRIVFSLREDYLHSLDAFQRKLPQLFSSAFRLLPLTAAGAREAIVRPLLRDAVSFEERTVTTLVNELAEYDFDSARLQVACAELCRRSVKDSSSADSNGRPPHTLALAPSTADHDLRSVFKRYLQGAVDAIPPGRHLLARALLDVLFASAGTKYALPLRSLVELEFGTARETCAVLLMLWQQKILRRQRREGCAWYELRHECLVEPIEEWLDENEEFSNYRQVRDIIKRTAQDGRFRERTPMLLSHDQLDRLVAPNKERFRLSDDEKEYVFLSAVYDRSPDAAWWAAKLGNQRSEDILLRRLTLAGAPVEELDQTMLRGAATTAGSIPACRPEIADRLLAIALHADLPPEVRRAAGASLGARADDRHFAEIGRRIGFFHTPKNVRELLADLHESKQLAGRFSWWQRRRARVRAQKRRIDARLAEIREAGGTGSMAGAFGGLTWSLTSGALMTLILLNAGGIGSDLTWVFWLTTGMTTVLATSLGALLGLFFARGAEKNHAVSRRFDLETAVGASKLCFMLPGVIGIIASILGVMLIDQTTETSDRTLMILWYAGGIVFFFAVGWSGRRVMRIAAHFSGTCASGFPARRRMLWLIPPNLVLLGLIPAALFVAIDPNTITYDSEFPLRRDETSLILQLFGLCAVGVFGWILMVATASMASLQRDLIGAGPAFSVRAGRRARWIAGCGALLTVPLFLLSFGFDSLPLPAAWLPRVTPDHDGVVQWRPTMNVWCDSDRAAVAVDLPSRFHVFSIESLPSDLSITMDGDPVSTRHHIFVPTTLRVTLAAANNQPSEGPALPVILRPVPILSGEHIVLERRRTVFVQVPLNHSVVTVPMETEGFDTIQEKLETKSDQWTGRETTLALPTGHVDDRLQIAIFGLAEVERNRHYRISANFADIEPTNLRVSGGVNVASNTDWGESKIRAFASAAENPASVKLQFTVLPDDQAGMHEPSADYPTTLVVGLRLEPKHEERPYMFIRRLRSQIAGAEREDEEEENAFWERHQFGLGELYDLDFAKQLTVRYEHSALAWDFLAHAHYRRDDWDDAVAAWDKALSIDHEYAKKREETCQEDQARLEDARRHIHDAPVPAVSR